MRDPDINPLFQSIMQGTAVEVLRMAQERGMPVKDAALVLVKAGLEVLDAVEYMSKERIGK